MRNIRSLILIPILLGIVALGVFIFAQSHERPIDGTEAVGIMYKIEASNKLDYYAEDVHFVSASLALAKYALLDSIIDVMRDYRHQGFQYVLKVHSHQAYRGEAEERGYSQVVADALKQYMVNTGIPPESITALGVGRIERLCFDKSLPDCARQNNRLEVEVK